MPWRSFWHYLKSRFRYLSGLDRVARKTATPRLAVVRMHEVSGTAREGWTAAVRAAIDQARKEIDGSEVIGFEVVRFAGDTTGRSIRAYRATVRVAYRDRAIPPKRP
jgi:flavin-binding protein dodecin